MVGSVDVVVNVGVLSLVLMLVFLLLMLMFLLLMLMLVFLLSMLMLLGESFMPCFCVNEFTWLRFIGIFHVSLIGCFFVFVCSGY